MFVYAALIKFCVAFLLVEVGAAKNLNPLDENLAQQWPCPSEEDIAPCVCTYDEDYALSLDCSEVQTVDKLAEVFAAKFPFKEFELLSIKQDDCDNCSITSLPSGILGDVSFKDIDISGTQIEVIEEQVFSASHDRLVTLRLTLNKISSFPFESLESYKSLGYLYLDKNELVEENPIPNMVFENLIIINLSSNTLTVSPEFVSDCPVIKHVRLRNTGMIKVPVFDESPISMFTGLQKLELIDYGNNQISEIQSGTVVAEAATLKTVDFSSNNISILEPGFVTGFSENTQSTLVMSYNSIVHLEQEVWEDIFNELPYENSIDLSGNPLLCGCDVQWLIQSSLKNSLTNTTTCEDGVSIVKYLPEAAFIMNC